jgi:nitroimidazol reductase NimA-like FMN-containing flavoprotein (pyridoxamine 5'-phosphate oxidase superfamily)
MNTLSRDVDGVPVPDGPIGTARPRAPRISKLGVAACKAILARNHVGRLAYVFHDAVDIVPLHYVYEDEWLYGRTSPGHKLRMLHHHRWVAFEVDEVDDWFEWRSVVVRGGLYQLDEGLALPDVREHALEVLRRVMPTALTEDDPVPSRTMLFRIHVDSMTGRRATLAKR